jgi:hypothetical protein
VLIRQLPAESALVRALNDGAPPWSTTDHLLADLWAVWTKKDHPVRAEHETRARDTAKRSRVVTLRSTFNQRKRRYGLE